MVVDWLKKNEMVVSCEMIDHQNLIVYFLGMMLDDEMVMVDDDGKIETCEMISLLSMIWDAISKTQDEMLND